MFGTFKLECNLDERIKSEEVRPAGRDRAVPMAPGQGSLNNPKREFKYKVGTSSRAEWFR